MRTRSLAVVLGILWAGPAWTQTIIRVPADQPTLQAAVNAVNAANDGAIIEMAAGTYSYPSAVTIANKPQRFTIRAAAGAAVVLDGNGHDILRFTNTTLGQGRPVVFERLTFANGVSTTDGIAGGVLLSNAEGTFLSCVFQNNVANPPNQGGGGIYLAGARAFFSDTLWTGNTSRNYGAALVVSNSTAFVHNSQFVNNRTDLPGHLAFAPGGAIHVNGGSLVATNTRFQANRAGHAGGAIYAIGAPWTDPVSVPRSEVFVTNSLFLDNQALNDPGVVALSPPVGGAVHVEDQARFRCHHCRFLTNTARQGGAISSYRARVEVYHSEFRANRSTGAGLGEAVGGAVVGLSDDNVDGTTENGTINRPSMELIARDTLFQGAFGAVTTTARQGGCLFLGGDTNRAWGLNGVPQMGTPESNRASVELTRVVFSACQAVGDPGLPGFGGGLMGVLVSLSLTDSLVLSSTASSSGGAQSGGGGLFLQSFSSATLLRTTLARNSAGTLGGALGAFGGVLNLTQSQVIENSLSGSNLGSGLYTSPDTGGGGRPAMNLAGLVQGSVISNNTGPSAFQILETDVSSGPINALQYAGTTIFPNNTNAFFNQIAGAFNVAGLNALVVMRGAGNTDKAPNNDLVGPGTAPVMGAIRAVPSAVLPTAAPGEGLPVPAYVGYAWSGGSATLNGTPVAGNAGLLPTTSAGSYTLNVAGTPFATAVAGGPTPRLSLTATPSFIPPAGTVSLGWSTPSGTWLTNAIDQGVAITPAPAGAVNQSPNATLTYRGFLVAEEGGAVDIARVSVNADIIFGDGFD